MRKAGTVIAITAALAGCAPAARDAPVESPANQRAVVLRAVGADNMASLMHCWTDAFEGQQSKVAIHYTSALSADGARAMIERRAEFSPYAREFFPAEAAEFESTFGKQPELVPVAVGSFSSPGKTHALGIYVNQANPLDSLTVSQVRRVFAGDAMLRWGDLGASGEWSTAPVRTYGMLNLRPSGNPPGIVNYLRHRLNGGRPLTDSISQIPGDADRHALQQIVDAVAGDRFGIGYSGFAFSHAGSKSLGLTDTNGSIVTASTSTVATLEYPLSRLIYIAVRPDTENPENEATYDFLRFVRGPLGRDCIRADAAGFSPLPRTPQNYLTENGKVRVVGYNDMDQILTSINDRFREQNPQIEFELDLRGTRFAPPALTDGTSAFAPMGAEFPDAALADYRQRVGADPIAIRIAHASLSAKALSGPLAFFVHASNPLKSISVDNARRLFTMQDGADAIVRWGQLGLGPPWDDRPIKPCGLAPQTALADFLRKRKFGNHQYIDNVVGFPQSSEAVRFAADNTESLCFAAYIRRSPGVRALAVAPNDGAPAIEITPENIVKGIYPLDRYLYIYLRDSPGHGIDPLVREYLEFVLSPTGQAVIAASAREYLPLNRDEVREELAKLAPHF